MESQRKKSKVAWGDLFFGNFAPFGWWNSRKGLSTVHRTKTPAQKYALIHWDDFGMEKIDGAAKSYPLLLSAFFKLIFDCKILSWYMDLSHQICTGSSWHSMEPPHKLEHQTSSDEPSLRWSISMLWARVSKRREDPFLCTHTECFFLLTPYHYTATV